MSPTEGNRPDADVQHPGDDAAPGTPGTGENVCPVCKGSKVVNGASCENCGGTGFVNEGIGGG